MHKVGILINTIIDRRRSLLLKIFAVMAAALICVSFLPRTVFADSGPKRSISIEIKNAPSELYYVALLQQGERSPYFREHYDGDRIPEEDEWVREIFLTYEEDGYILFTYAGGASSVRSSETDLKGSDIVKYGYMVPSTFKVMIVTKSGEVTVSNEITAKAFYSECEYDYSTNTLKEVNFETNFAKDLAVESVIFCTIMLITEGIVLLCFGLFRKKNLLRFLIANLLTQTLLYVFNLTCRLIDPLWRKYYLIWFVVEALITVIELFIYRKKLVRKDGSVSVGRNIAYSITANAISAFIDIPIVFLAILIR